MPRMITTDEAARRLGVKVPTLYAYVSRGLLPSHPDPTPGHRGSLFELDDVEALAARSRGARPLARARARPMPPDDPVRPHALGAGDVRRHRRAARRRATRGRGAGGP